MRLLTRHAFALALAGAATTSLATPLSIQKPEPVSAALAPASSRACSSDEACIASVLAAAGAGRHIDQLLSIAQMGSVAAGKAQQTPGPSPRPQRAPETIAVGNADAILAAMLRDARNDYAAVPEYRRVSALVHMNANRLAEAERELRDAIAVFPTHAAFWVDLALVFGQQGKTDNAIAALVVADTWSGNQAALRRALEAAAGSVSVKDMAPAYRAALRLIAKNTAELERLDTELPAVSLASQAGRNDVEGSGAVLFDACQPPQWPRSSLRYEETGRVTLAFYIDADGKLLRARTLESSGHVELDNAAMSTIAACTFRPGFIKGKAVPGWAKVQYVWSLEDR